MTAGVPGHRPVDAYDLVIFDLDGVIYLVDRPIETAVTAVRRLCAEGKPLAYATNNASRRAGEVAALLAGMGIDARPDQVLTSAAAAAEVLAERLPAGSPVLVVGAEALRAEVGAVGLRPVDRFEDAPVAVVQGYGPRVGWAELAEATLAVRGGAEWVVTNTDRTLPTVRGPVPGNGSLVAVLRTALDREPDLVIGKPAPGLFRAAARRTGATRPLVVGDRLDTDVEGAVRAGMDSLLVLTGVSTPAELLRAPVTARPTYVAEDLAGLLDPSRVVRLPDAAHGRRPDSGWHVSREGETWVLSGAGSSLEALGVLCAVSWSGAAPIGSVRPKDTRARLALETLGLW